MVSPVARTVYPVSNEWVGVGREAAAGTAVPPTSGVPVDKGSPDDKPTFLMDKALRGSMAVEYGAILGTEIGAFDFSGPVYMDTIGFILHNILGDYIATGSTPTSSTTLAAGLAAGATSTTLTSATGYSVGATVKLGPVSGFSENLVIATLSGVNVTFVTPARGAWLSGAAIAVVSPPYTHTFSLLNSGSGQPATHTVTHYTGITPTGGETPNYAGTFGARQFASWCASEAAFTLNAAQLFEHSTKGVSYLGLPAAAQPAKSFSGVLAQPAWEAIVTVASTQVNSITEPSVAISRQVKPWFTADGSQAPFAMARNGLTVGGKFNHLAESDVPMMNMLNNTQPPVSMVVSNGLSGANLLSVTFNLAQAAYDTVKLNDNEEIEWQATWKGIANVTNIGASGGFSPVSVVLVNSVPTY